MFRFGPAVYKPSRIRFPRPFTFPSPFRLTAVDSTIGWFLLLLLLLVGVFSRRTLDPGRELGRGEALLWRSLAIILRSSTLMAHNNVSSTSRDGKLVPSGHNSVPRP